MASNYWKNFGTKLTKTLKSTVKKANSTIVKKVQSAQKPKSTPSTRIIKPSQTKIGTKPKISNPTAYTDNGKGTKTSPIVKNTASTAKARPSTTRKITAKMNETAKQTAQKETQKYSEMEKEFNSFKGANKFETEYTSQKINKLSGENSTLNREISNLKASIKKDEKKLSELEKLQKIDEGYINYKYPGGIRTLENDIANLRGDIKDNTDRISEKQQTVESNKQKIQTALGDIANYKDQEERKKEELSKQYQKKEKANKIYSQLNEQSQKTATESYLTTKYRNLYDDPANLKSRRDPTGNTNLEAKYRKLKDDPANLPSNFKEKNPKGTIKSTDSTKRIDRVPISGVTTGTVEAVIEVNNQAEIDMLNQDLKKYNAAKLKLEEVKIYLEAAMKEINENTSPLLKKNYDGESEEMKKISITMTEVYSEIEVKEKKIVEMIEEIQTQITQINTRLKELGG